MDLAETVTGTDVRRLSGHYRWAERWLRDLALAEGATDHVEVFFGQQVLGGLADDFALISAGLDAAAGDDVAPSPRRLLELYRRLVWIFTANLDTFERKTFASLSHEANKVMNLNSYIGLMGRRFRLEEGPSGKIL